MSHNKAPQMKHLIRNNIGISLILSSILLSILGFIAFLGTPLLMALIGGLETNSSGAAGTAIIMVLASLVMMLSSVMFPAGVVVFIVEEVAKRRKLEAQIQATAPYGDANPPRQY